MRALFVILIVDQDAVGRTIEIFELPVAHSPEKHRQTEYTEAKSNGDKEEKPGHRVDLASRSELATTTSELSDIAIAAIRGVTSPARASGTARTL